MTLPLRQFPLKVMKLLTVLLELQMNHNNLPNSDIEEQLPKGNSLKLVLLTFFEINLIKDAQLLLFEEIFFGDGESVSKFLNCFVQCCGRIGRTVADLEVQGKRLDQIAIFPRFF
jgi:hypothetical protein